MCLHYDILRAGRYIMATIPYVTSSYYLKTFTTDLSYNAHHILHDSRQGFCAVIVVNTMSVGGDSSTEYINIYGRYCI